MKNYIIAIAVAGLAGLGLWMVVAGCGKVTPTEPQAWAITGTIQLLIVLDSEGARAVDVPVAVTIHHQSHPGPLPDTVWTNANGSALLDYRVPCYSVNGFGRVTVSIGDNQQAIEWIYTHGEVAPIWFYILR